MNNKLEHCLKRLIARRRKAIISDIKMTEVTININQEKVQRMVDIFSTRLLLVAKSHFIRLRRWNTAQNQKTAKFLTAVNKVIRKKQVQHASTLLSCTSNFADNFIKSVEKVENRYGLPRKTLITEILKVEETPQGEKISTALAPSKLNQQQVTVKNGYIYLNILLRKLVNKRISSLFDLNSRHTLDMRYVQHLNKVLTRGPTQKG